MQFSAEKSEKVLMKEEVAATWFATSLIMCVVGAQFSAREQVSAITRSTIEILFLSLALLICLWTIASYFSLIGTHLHKNGFIAIILATMGSFIYLISLSASSVV